MCVKKGRALKTHHSSNARSPKEKQRNIEKEEKERSCTDGENHKHSADGNQCHQVILGVCVCERGRERIEEREGG